MNALIAGPTTRSEPAPRRHELDWLRTLVVLGIIPYHALVIFGASSAVYIKSTQSSPALALIGGFVLTWGIQSLFLMSGAATRLALQHRTPGAYVGERLGRLFVPMLLVVLVFSPLQAYYILLSNPSLVNMSPVPIQNAQQLGSFGTFYTTYLTILVTTVRAYTPSIGTIVLAHVWFIPRLLVVSLLTVLLVVLLRRFGQRILARVGGLLQQPIVVLFGGGIVTAFIVALLRPGWVERLTAHWVYTDVWADFFLDFSLFLCGYLIYSRLRLYAAVRDFRVFILVLGMVCWIAVAGATMAGKVPPTSLAPASIAYSGTMALSAWLLSLALLGLAMRYLTFTTRPQRYLTYAAFPVYLLHMPILTICAYYVLKLPSPWYIQLLLIVAVTVTLAFGIFDLVVRRTPVTRFLFGVPRREPKGAMPSVSSASAMQADNAVLEPSRVPSRLSDDMDPASEANLAQLFRHRSQQYAEAIRWRQQCGDAQRVVTFAEQQALVNRLISGLDALGARPDDAIGILSGTRWEWIVADWAITGLGAVTTAIYSSLTQETVSFILRDAGVSILFIEDETQFEKVRDVLDDLPGLQRLVIFDESSEALADKRVISFTALLSLSPRTAQEADAFAADCAQRIQPDDRAAVIYTSGTTGRPKGVVLTHRALLAQLAGAHAMLNTVHAGTVDTLFLPLSHVLGRLEHLFGVDRGAETIILPSMDHLAQDIAAAHPDILLGAPRVFEKAHAAILERVAASSPIQQTLFRWADRVGRTAVRYRQKHQRRPPFTMRIQLVIADAIVFRRIRAAFGGRLQFAVTGAAPLEPSIIEFFYAVGIPLLEGWGLTETGGAFTVNKLDDWRIGTVGKPFPGHQVCIAPDGEILLRGPCVFSRYHNNPTATSEGIDADGWFHTGDVGSVDPDGFLSIVDRKKELIATAGGKKVAPQFVEGLLKSDPLVSQACVYGDRKPYLVAVLTLDWMAVKRWADEQSIPFVDVHDLATSPTLRAHFDEHVAHVNDHLARFEQVKYYDILTDEFTVENGLLTPTQKIRRKEVNVRYQDQFEALYSSARAVQR